MKKIFHLGIIAITALSVSSCTKSGADLLAKEQKEKDVQQNQSLQQKKISFLGTRNHHVNNANIWLDASKIYPFINQPLEMQLGNPDSKITQGQIAVFYIVLSDDVADLIPTTAVLNLSDDETGDIISTHNLISYKDVGVIDAFVPAELVNIPFMCALVPLDSRHIDKTISLNSYIEYIGAFTGASLSGAFKVTL
ncbi:MAG TPA: hypothetical protein VN451_08180 [Chitinophagaceae bacterium]|nr:hypothetical protein [Chitinophagaceae bacterium]